MPFNGAVGHISHCGFKNWTRVRFAHLGRERGRQRELSRPSAAAADGDNLAAHILPLILLHFLKV